MIRKIFPKFKNNYPFLLKNDKCINILTKHYSKRTLGVRSKKNSSETFESYDKGWSGTDWYDQGRSMVCSIVPILEDNYCFIILINNVTKVIVDPADAFEVRKVLDRLHTDVPRGLSAILTTHKHEDHTGGNLMLSQMFNGSFYSDSTNAKKNKNENFLPIYGPKYDGHIPAMTHPVSGGDSFEIGGIKSGITSGSLHVKVIDTPFHTKGSISYLCERKGTLAPPALFCGMNND